MKKIILLFTLILLICSVFAGGAAAEGKYGIKYAEKFDIEYYENNIKVVTDSAGKKFLLVPEKAAVPEKLAAQKELTLVRTPVKRILCGSTTYVSYLRKLDKSKKIYDSITAVFNDEKDWTEKEIISRLKSGAIRCYPLTSGQKPDAEKIMTLAPDVIFSTELISSMSSIEPQLRSTGTVSVSVDEYLETSDYGSIEWLKFFGAFYNMDREADELFNEVYTYLEGMKAKIKKLRKDGRITPVTVAFGSYTRGVLYTVSGNSTFTRMMENAGGVYTLRDEKQNGVVPVSMEAFLNRCRDADVFIYKGSIRYMPDKKALIAQNPLFGEFKAFKNNNIYVFAEDFYINSAEIKEKFEDVVCILHPELMPGHRLKHYIRLGD